jgi:hypothetical protein
VAPRLRRAVFRSSHNPRLPSIGSRASRSAFRRPGAFAIAEHSIAVALDDTANLLDCRLAVGEGRPNLPTLSTGLSSSPVKIHRHACPFLSLTAYRRRPRAKLSATHHCRSRRDLPAYPPDCTAVERAPFRPGGSAGGPQRPNGIAQQIAPKVAVEAYRRPRPPLLAPATAIATQLVGTGWERER